MRLDERRFASAGRVCMPSKELLTYGTPLKTKAKICKVKLHDLFLFDICEKPLQNAFCFLESNVPVL